VVAEILFVTEKEGGGGGDYRKVPHLIANNTTCFEPQGDGRESSQRAAMDDCFVSIPSGNMVPNRLVLASVGVVDDMSSRSTRLCRQIGVQGPMSKHSVRAGLQSQKTVLCGSNVLAHTDCTRATVLSDIQALYYSKRRSAHQLTAPR
jgi:hypothetical protein